MLDLNHPMTKHIFKASGLKDGLLVRVQRMTVVPSVERDNLRQECQRILCKLQQLNDEHFKASPFITEAIHEMQIAIEQIANLGNKNVLVDLSDEDGICPVCNTEIKKLILKSIKGVIISCDTCMKPFWPPYMKMDSHEGFGTCFI